MRAMYGFFLLLSRLNKALLPKIHRKPDLTRLSAWEKAVVGWKLWVTYRLLDLDKAHSEANSDAKAPSTHP